MATGTMKQPIEIETSQLTKIVSFSSVYVNKLTKIGNIVVVEFRGVASSAAGASWKRILAFPDGWEAENSIPLTAVVNNAPAVSFTYKNSGEAKNKSINISTNYGASADISITGVYTVAE